MKARNLSFQRLFLLILPGLGLFLLPGCEENVSFTEHSEKKTRKTGGSGLSLSSSATTTITVNGKTVYTSGGSIQSHGNTVVLNGKMLSSGAVQGSGAAKTESRELAAFKAVQLQTNANLTIKTGEKHRCSVTAEDNLLPLIRTETDGNTLRIFSGESYSSSLPITISIETPAIEKVDLVASGTITLPEVSGETLDLHLSGAGNIHASGKSKDLRATVTGAGNIRALDLRTENTVVRILGSGNAEVCAENQLDAKISGSGNISYTGAAAILKIDVLGSGSISRR
jgi:hypothetical protein